MAVKWRNLRNTAQMCGIISKNLEKKGSWIEIYWENGFLLEGQKCKIDEGVLDFC